MLPAAGGEWKYRPRQDALLVQYNTVKVLPVVRAPISEDARGTSSCVHTSASTRSGVL